MKKITLLLVIVASISFVWWKTSTTQKSVPSSPSSVTSVNQKAQEILAADYEKIALHLKKENTTGDEWRLVNDYSLPPGKIVNPDNAALFFKVTQGNIPEMYACLKKDFCGMQTRSLEDSYFDEQRTPAHILINRSLKVMQSALRSSPELKNGVDWDLMQELAGSDSEMLSVEALDIIREFNTDGIKTDELIGLTEDYKGQAKAQALLNLSKTKNKTDKVLVASEVEDVFTEADANTVISVLENVKAMAFDARQSAKILASLCRFKEMEDEERNWLMIKHVAQKINSNFEKNCN